MPDATTGHARRGLLTVVSITVGSLLVIPLARSTTAFPNYNLNGSGCIQCHGEFDGPLSLSGSVFPQDSKHEMHRGTGNMNTECKLCHVTPGDDPSTFMSGGTPDTPGLGCVGCHGREEGVNGLIGAGLRRIHAAAGIVFCAGCHPDDPVTLVGEDVPPPYYGSPDTNANDPCNAGPDYLESWTIGDTRGLDNDGDGLYDEADCLGGSCPGDVDGSGDTGFSDILVIIANWGPCSPGPCPADVSMNGDVDFADILAVIGTWGPCL